MYNVYHTVKVHALFVYPFLGNEYCRSIEASKQADDYTNIYCSISGATCIIAYAIVYAGNNGVGIGNKQYKTNDAQQLLDVLYSYGYGSQFIITVIQKQEYHLDINCLPFKNSAKFGKMNGQIWTKNLLKAIVVI